MKIGITKLIAENIAPSSASSLAIFDGDRKICNVDIAKMRPTNLGEKLYSFGLISDMHLDGIGSNGSYLSEEMTFFENQGCDFCCHAGDMTNIGFWYPISETEKSSYYYTEQFADYKSVITLHKDKLPMHGCCGNHESYNEYHISGKYTDIYGDDPTLEIDNPVKLKEYTDRELFYTYEHYNDIFIFWSQPSASYSGAKEKWEDGLVWLQERLEENRNKRCFVFAHPPLNNDSGNPGNIYGGSLWGGLEVTLVDIMSHYKNAILFHGHSHLDFNEQLNWSYSNYSTSRGFKSVGIPSCSGSRITVDGVLQKVNDATLRSGYIADIYENCIVLKGYYFQNFEIVPIAQYCIDTTLQSVETRPFTDSTVTIKTEENANG